jgi:DNA-directed RNA polymerase subunit H
MDTTFELIDQLYRSRQTILKILEDRDYNIKPYEKFGPGEIEAMLVATATTLSKQEKEREKGSAFRIDVERKEFKLDSKDPKEREKAAKWADTPIRKCRVMYIFTRLKNRLATSFITNITTPGRDDYVDFKDTELIVILAHPDGEAVVDTFHSLASNQWASSKIRISFFRLANLVIHPSTHSLVPKHEFIPKKEIDKLFSTAERVKLPFIRFHEDMQARILGLVPGDVVKITRPSPASGEYTIYRICA